MDGRKRKLRVQWGPHEGMTEAFAGRFGEQVRKGPRDVEGLMDVPGLNLVNPIASYTTFEPAPRITNLADEASLSEDPSEKQ